MSNPIPTTRNERFGFYMFAIASEPYFAAALSVIIPIIIKESVRKAGLPNIADPTGKCEKNQKCFILGGLDTDTYVLFCNSIGVLIQTFVFISISSVADYGSAFTCLLYLINNQNYWTYSLLAILSNVFFGASYVFYYAYVPTLTVNSARIINLTSLYENEKISFEQLTKEREKIGNSISGKGFAAGYFSAVLVLVIISLWVIYSGYGSSDTYRHSIAFVGAWFFIVSAICLKLILSRPSPPLPPNENYFRHSWSQFISTIAKFKRLKSLFLFLFSWFFLSDAIHSIITVSLLFALNMGIEEKLLMIPATIIPLAAGVGNLILNYIQKKCNISTKKMIMTIISLYILLLSYTLLGFIPGIKYGFTQQWEIYALAVYHGFLLGSIQSFYRVQFSEILPIGKENEFFGLYEITDKGSTWFGPLVIGALNHFFGLRSGFVFILLLLFVALYLTYVFDPLVALDQARAYNSNASTKEDSLKDSK